MMNISVACKKKKSELFRDLNITISSSNSSKADF